MLQFAAHDRDGMRVVTGPEFTMAFVKFDEYLETRIVYAETASLL